MKFLRLLRKRKHAFLLATLLFLLLVSLLISMKTLATPTKNVTVTSNVYFVLPNGAEINFANGQDFNSLAPDNATGEWYWVFDSYQFRTENANMTITNYFSNNQLIFDLDGMGMSTTKIYLASRGPPEKVTGASSWNYEDATKILTVNVSHSSPEEVAVIWAVEITSIFTNLYTAMSIASLTGIVLVAATIIMMFRRGLSPEGLVSMVAILIVVTIAISVTILILSNLQGIIG